VTKYSIQSSERNKGRGVPNPNNLTLSNVDKQWSIVENQKGGSCDGQQEESLIATLHWKAGESI
jgi:hypothetical protein